MVLLAIYKSIEQFSNLETLQTLVESGTRQRCHYKSLGRMACWINGSGATGYPCRTKKKKKKKRWFLPHTTHKSNSGGLMG